MDPGTDPSQGDPPLFAAIRFELEKLRGKRCGKIFTAPPPPEAGLEKSDPTVGPLRGSLRFGGGLPHYRLDRMQTDLGVRLPASMQWELRAQAGQAMEPAQEALITLAAQGRLIHNDDTPLRGQSLAKEAGPAAQGPERHRDFHHQPRLRGRGPHGSAVRYRAPSRR
ncbi:MAG: transposase [Verrucomicrobiota bacterium]